MSPGWGCCGCCCSAGTDYLRRAVQCGTDWVGRFRLLAKRGSGTAAGVAHDGRSAVRARLRVTCAAIHTARAQAPASGSFWAASAGKLAREQRRSSQTASCWVRDGCHAYLRVLAGACGRCSRRQRWPARGSGRRRLSRWRKHRPPPAHAHGQSKPLLFVSAELATFCDGFFSHFARNIRGLGRGVSAPERRRRPPRV